MLTTINYLTKYNFSSQAGVFLFVLPFLEITFAFSLNLSIKRYVPGNSWTWTYSIGKIHSFILDFFNLLMDIYFFQLQFFPKTEKYVSLFMGGDDNEIVEKRNRLRKLIKENILAAAASGKDLDGIFFILLLLHPFIAWQKVF